MRARGEHERRVDAEGGEKAGGTETDHDRAHRGAGGEGHEVALHEGDVLEVRAAGVSLSVKKKIYGRNVLEVRIRW